MRVSILKCQELTKCNGPVAVGGWSGVARADPGIHLVQVGAVQVDSSLTSTNESESRQPSASDSPVLQLERVLPGPASAGGPVSAGEAEHVHVVVAASVECSFA